jgi:hypothetical protein
VRLWLGLLPLLLGSALVVLPAWRIAQGRLTVRGALGLWISAAGFGLLAFAALRLDGGALQGALWMGIVLLGAGNLVQRRVAAGSPPPTRDPPAP